MVQNTMLGDMLASLFERRRASGTANDPRPIEKMCQTLLTSEGEVFGIHLAKAILTRYSELDQDAKLAFFFGF